jgi:short-subunit dehydrogenase
MKDLDVSVLVNNVGIPTISLFNMNPSEVNRYLSANARCMSLFSQIFIKKFKLRKNKSAIINLSSLMSK